MRQFTAFTLLTLLLLASVALCAEWPQFRGVKNDGYSPEQGINKAWNQKAPAQLWQVTMSDKGHAGVAVAQGKVFIIDHQGEQDVVRALDIATGKDVWTYSYADAFKMWYGYARSTPTVDGQKLYTVSASGLLNCLDTATGKSLWKKNFIADFGGKLPKWGFAGSPVVDGEKLLICPGGADASVVALNKTTGEVVWKGGGSDEPGYCTPVIATINGKRQYVVFTAKGLIGVEDTTGKVLWQFPWDTRFGVNAAMPIVVGNTIFITSGYKKGCALVEVKGDTATARWQNTNMQAHFNSPIVADGYIYGNSDPGNLVCLELATGNTTWSQAGFEKGGLIAIDGAIIAMQGATGDVKMVKLQSTAYEELGAIKPLDGQSWAAPVVADGKLFIRNTKALVCLDLK